MFHRHDLNYASTMAAEMKSQLRSCHWLEILMSTVSSNLNRSSAPLKVVNQMNYLITPFKAIRAPLILLLSRRLWRRVLVRQQSSTTSAILIRCMALINEGLHHSFQNVIRTIMGNKPALHRSTQSNCQRPVSGSWTIPRCVRPIRILPR